MGQCIVVRWEEKDLLGDAKFLPPNPMVGSNQEFIFSESGFRCPQKGQFVLQNLSWIPLVCSSSVPAVWELPAGWRRWERGTLLLWWDFRGQPRLHLRGKSKSSELLLRSESLGRRSWWEKHGLSSQSDDLFWNLGLPLPACVTWGKVLSFF